MTDTLNIMQPAERSFMDRVWPRLGFGMCSNPDPWPEDMEGFPPGHITTDSFMHFDILDRLRILLSGKVMTVTSTKCDVVVEKALSEMSVSVLPPSWKR